MIQLHVGGLYQITHLNRVDRDEWLLAEVLDGGELLRFCDPHTKQTILPLTPRADFIRAYGEERVRYIPFEGKGHRLGKAGREDLPPVVTDEMAPLRLAICEAFDNGGYTTGRQTLKRLVSDVLKDNPALKLLDWEPSSGAVVEWLKKRGIPGRRLETEMINRSGRVSRKSRRSELAKEIVRRSSAWYYAGELRSHEQAWAWACKLRRKLNGRLRIRKGNKLATICETIKESTVSERIRLDRCYETVEMKWGIKRAIDEYGGSEPTIGADEALERVIIDATRIDVHIVDLLNGRYLGKPWIVFCIDVKTRMILGWFIAFANPSVQFAIDVLRHVILPKLDLKERYGLDHDCEAFGVPGLILVDNAWEQTGAAYRRACRSQGIELEWAPVKSPKYKPYVERAVRTLNTRVLHRARGGIPAPPHVLRRLGIDPLKDKRMTLLQLRAAVNKAFVDDYPRRKHKGLNGEVPLVVWRRHMELREIPTVDNPKFLDGLGKVIRNRTLDRHGVRYDGWQYGENPAVLTALLRDLQHNVPDRQQRQDGSSRKAKTDIVRNPGNIHRIVIFNPKTGTNWALTVRGPDAKITEGMSEFTWDGIKEYATRNNLPFSSPEQRAKVVDDMRVTLEQVDERTVAAERFRYQQMRDGMPKPSLQGDMVTVIKLPSKTPGGPAVLPIDGRAALAAAAAIPKGRRRGGASATRKAKATAAMNRAKAAVAAKKEHKTANGNPAAFVKLEGFDEEAARQFRTGLGKDYQHPDAARSDVNAPSVAPQVPEETNVTSSESLVVEDANAFRAALSADYAMPDKTGR